MDQNSSIWFNSVCCALYLLTLRINKLNEATSVELVLYGYSMILKIVLAVNIICKGPQAESNTTFSDCLQLASTTAKQQLHVSD